MTERLSGSDRRLLWCCLVIAVLGLWIGVSNYSRAFPEASIQFRVTRESSWTPAIHFLKARRLDTTDYYHAAIFGYDDLAKVFLERELGLEEATKLIREHIHLWRWQHRWFRPLHKEEMQVEVATTGKVVSFSHELPEEESGAHLDRGQAQRLAEGFLSSVMQLDRRQLEFVEATNIKRPRRTDHSFTWKDRRVKVGDASYRYEVTVQGDRIDAFNEFLKIPDQWQRDYEKLRSLNNVTGVVDTLFMGLSMLALLVMLVRAIRAGTVPWRTAVLLGGAAFCISLLAHLNNLPLALYQYNTTETYGSFLLRQFASGIILAGGGAAAVLLLAAGAEPLYREQHGRKLAFANLFSWRGLRSREFLLANAVGLTMTFFFFAYETVFYSAARALGAWSPAEVPYDNLLSTAIPWAFVLLYGFFPATTEEFLSRMFSIPFCQKYLRSTIAALILPALIWGFGHATYPQQPFFIRGLEVGLVGIMAGIVMLRLGIAATLIWHYTTDAFFTAFLMLRSGQPYFVVSGGMAAGVMFLPLFLAAIAYRRHNGFEPATQLCNDALPRGTEAAPAPQEIPAFPACTPLARRRLLVATLGISFLAGFWLLRPDQPGTFARAGVGQVEARQAADAFLARRGVDARRYWKVLPLEIAISDWSALYMLQEGGVALLNRTYRDLMPGLIWAVRYFRPLEEEEWQVRVDARQGYPVGFTHTVPETAPGADLSREPALAQARRAVASLGAGLAGYQLRESTSERKKARRDHQFVWESTKPLIGEARLRVSVAVQGAEAGSVERYFKLPEAWLRFRQESRPLHVAHRVLRIVLAFCLLLYILLLFLRSARRGQVPWAPVCVVSGVLAMAPLVNLLNTWPLIYENYSTSISPTVHLVNTIAGHLLAAMGEFLAYVLALGCVAAKYPYLPGMFHAPSRRLWARDALYCGILALAAVWGLQGLNAWLLGPLHHWAIFGGVFWPGDLAAVSPFASTVLESLQASVIVAALVGLMAGAVSRLRGGLRWLLFLLVSVAVASNRAQLPAEFLLSWGMTVLQMALGVGMVGWLWQDNPGAYLFSPFLLLTVRDGVGMLLQPLPWARLNGTLLLVVALGVAGWLWRAGGPANSIHPAPLPPGP